MILLDTNAIIWLQRSHSRARPLKKAAVRLYLSAASILELQFLSELGRITLSSHVSAIITAGDWLLDDPHSARWFEGAAEVGWTRDPLDRLIVAHAQLRGWRLATGPTCFSASG